MFDSRRTVAGIANSRLVLMAGFGGLLVLMAFAGVDAINTLAEIQTSNDTIRDDFLLRTRVLERIRADLYISGTYVRDYLLERESAKAVGNLSSLIETRNDMDRALGDYRKLLNAQESTPFQVLTAELEAYWHVLEPVFRWSPQQRQRDGYPFLRDEVFRRRISMLGIADRIGALNERQLQAGKTRVEQTFVGFRKRLLITLVSTIGLGLVFASFSMRKLLSLETEAAGHYREIANTRTELKQLSARLVEAQENERRSISRDLHDQVGQELTGILMEMAHISILIRARDTEAAEVKAGEIKRLVESCLQVVRNMALLLRPSMLDDLGLVPALQWQAKEVSKRSGLRVKVVAEDVSEDLPEEHKTCIFRIVQEALHNIVQHAGAVNVSVTVRQEAGRLLLSIQDDGKGFDADRERGMGLLGMQERVSNLEGTFEVISEPSRGTGLRVSLPLIGARDGKPMQTI
jgi:signal transduction histidine kinase